MIWIVGFVIWWLFGIIFLTVDHICNSERDLTIYEFFKICCVGIFGLSLLIFVFFAINKDLVLIKKRNR